MSWRGTKHYTIPQPSRDLWRPLVQTSAQSRLSHRVRADCSGLNPMGSGNPLTRETAPSPCTLALLPGCPCGENTFSETQPEPFLFQPASFTLPPSTAPL